MQPFLKIFSRGKNPIKLICSTYINDAARTEYILYHLYSFWKILIFYSVEDNHVVTSLKNKIRGIKDF